MVLGIPRSHPARLPSCLYSPCPGGLLSTRGRPAKARLQGSSEVRPRRGNSLGTCGPGGPRGRVHCPAECSAFRVGLLFWRKQGGNVLRVQFLGGRCGTRNGRAGDSRHSLYASYNHLQGVCTQVPAGLVARIRRFHRCGPGSIPGQGSLCKNVFLLFPLQRLHWQASSSSCPDQSCVLLQGSDADELLH